ncbi:MAG: hypothetical protein ACTH1Z_08345 [Ancrocorticia sp.]|uniref:hypothetical protein n=1 Tax=Ancrocorticia sp. TaxID=2593684 RepID=UPI003F910557
MAHIKNRSVKGDRKGCQISRWKLVTGAAVVGPAAVVAFLNSYQKKYVVDTTPAETPLPGDDLLTDEGRNELTMQIEIDAPPEKVWPLINQLGQHKAGFYSFQLFENMVHFRIRNTYEPQDRWQDTKVGDWTFYGQQGIGHRIELLEEGKYFVGKSDSRTPPTNKGAIAWTPAGTREFAWTWGFFLEELPGGRTRFTTRNLSWADIEKPIPALIVAGLMWGWSSGVMQTRLLEVVKACAEGRRFLEL